MRDPIETSWAGRGPGTGWNGQSSKGLRPVTLGLEVEAPIESLQCAPRTGWWEGGEPQEHMVTDHSICQSESANGM